MSESIINSIEQLEAIYGRPAETSLVKETRVITAEYRRLIQASPFAVLASRGADGLDCSPRGDLPGFVRCVDQHTLMLPDRKGNNRVDTLRNIIHDPAVALLFLIPGSGTTLRVNGRATLSTAADLLESFTVNGAAPRSVIVIRVEAVYFQCARAIVRAGLWNPEQQVDNATLPTPGQILAALSDDRLGGADYDSGWPDRAKKTMW